MRRRAPPGRGGRHARYLELTGCEIPAASLTLGSDAAGIFGVQAGAPRVRRPSAPPRCCREPFAEVRPKLQLGVVPLADLDQGATAAFPIQGCVVLRAWAIRYPGTLAAFRAAFEQGQEIADQNRPAVEQAMEALPAPLALTPVQAAVMALDEIPVDAVS